MTFTPYANSGPFTNNVTPPGISATFLNNVENFLDQIDSSVVADTNISSNGSGVLTVTGLHLLTGSLTRIAKAGPYSVTSTLTAFNHHLGAVPDFVIVSIDAGSTTPHQCYVEYASLTSTQVKLQADNFLTVYTLCLKF